MQKKILLAIVVVLINPALHAQIKNGSFFLGGQIAFLKIETSNASSAGIEKSGNSTVNISPAFGKAIKENLIIGFDVNIYYYKDQPPANYGYVQKTNFYGAGFFVRRYKNLGKDFYLFAQGRLGLYYGTQKTTYTQQPLSDAADKIYSTQLSVYPGIAYSVNRKLQIEAGFNNLAYIEYDHDRQTNLSSSSLTAVTNTLYLGSSLSNLSGLTIGFRVLLN